jgi:HEAT repeat protein
VASTDRLDDLRALRTANLDLAFATAFASLVGGNFQQAFALELGATPRLLALIAALPAIIGVLQIPGSVIGERYLSYKTFVAIGGFLWRFAWLPVVFLPLAPAYLPRLQILIACIVISAASVFFVQATYNAWLSFLVPESHRGWYFSRRIALGTVVSVVIGLPASIALDWMEKQQDFTVGLSLIFGAGVLFGFISFALYMRMPNTKREATSQLTLRESMILLGKPLKDKRFNNLLIFLVVFVFAQTFAAPFFFPYGRQVLKLDFLQFQIFAAFHAAATLLSAPMWGYFSDKYGNKPVLFVSGALLCLGPFSWAICNPSYGIWNFVILAIGHATAGFSWTGVAVGQGNIILANTAPELRAQAIGLSQAVIAAVGFFSQMAGGEFMQRTIGIMSDEKRYGMLFIANGALRLVAVLLLFIVRDETSTSIRGFLRQIAAVRPKGVLAMRKLSSADSVRAKERAIRALGEAGMSMAETELSHLLMDPSPRIRREAAEALRAIGGQEAVAALARLIERHPHLAEEEMIEAMAAIGHESAVPSLITLLENPSSALRRASAKALGKLRSPRALGALIAAAANPEDKELRRASIQALRLIGDPICEPVIAQGLQDPYPSVRVAAAEACAELELRDCAPILREGLLGEVDDTCAEFAYALACVGDGGDAETILIAAAKLSSSVARRRCLLATAKLFKVEAGLYRLLMADSVTRDQALIEITKSVSGFRRALVLYHRGDEHAALAHLSSKLPNPRLALIANHSPKEGFLLAAALMD